MSRKVLFDIKTGVIFALFLIIWLFSCSRNLNRADQCNAEITFSPPSEPLFESVTSAHFSLIGSVTGVILDTVLTLEAPSWSIAPIYADLQSEEDLTFSAWFYDQVRRPLYRVLESAAYSDPMPENITLHPMQTGYRSGTNVKILRDQPPWESYGVDSVLAGMGLTVGTSVYQFSIYTSSELSSIELAPETDILIISNDQAQIFYDNLAMHFVRITEFAGAGGTIFWETCDLAWNYGSYAAAGIDSFPGGISHVTSYDPLNSVADRDLNFVNGLGDTLSGGYASNKHFINVPDSAIIYTRDTDGYPTLMGLKFGEGIIFYSGQPLEYNYDRRSEYNIGYLLPRVFGFLLGIPWEEPSLYSPGRAAESGREIAG